MKKTITEIKNCTGCGACKALCPFKAISMVANAEGFLYPVIDMTKCVNCGLCLNRCPAEHSVYINSHHPQCLAMAADNQLREKSSSGGIFPLLAEYVLGKGGYVCGTSWNKENLVEHVIIDSKEELSRLKGSKYLQSDTRDVYKDIEELLKLKKLVLFSGTPCQVAGLNAYLNKSYDNLITVDIICHGVPSPKVYKKYLQDLVQNKEEKVIETNFRDKINGWSPYLTTTTTTTTATYSFAAEKDSFMTAFLKNLCLRSSCAQCPFAKIPRQGDITLGDFWGIDKYSKKLNDKKGLSCVLINTAKGKKYISAIKQQAKLCRCVPIKYAIKGNPCLVRSSIPHKNRSEFLERVDKLPLKDNVDIALGRKYDCGILNFWFCDNYGAMLTCYALQETIKSLGKYPRVINYIPIFYLYNFKNSKSFRFAERYLDLTQLCKTKEDLRKLNEETDTFIVGSDQVWRYKYFWSLGGNIFQLNFANSRKKKIAYAASFGISFFEGKEEDTQRTKYYLHQFDKISVRENDGVTICRDTFDVSAEQVLDPVFLVEKSSWDKMINNATLADKDFIVSYVLDKSLLSENILKTIKSLFANTKSVDMGDGQSGEKTSIENWLFAIKNCKFFITDSFHGACFAILFNKPFICIANKERGYSRFSSLFKIFGLENRCVLSSDIDVKNLISQKIDYDRINQIMQKEIYRSRTWLENAMNAPIKEKGPKYDLLEIEILKKEMLEKKHKLKKLKRKYFKYYILSKLFFGKRREEYKKKQFLYKEQIRH